MAQPARSFLLLGARHYSTYNRTLLSVGKWESPRPSMGQASLQPSTSGAGHGSIGINATWQHSLLAAQELGRDGALAL
ncbi:hypothetical protein CCMA1212_004639 [Trichoderma ghanense]|uniref:Uncharacterized protein n=1 Tax=Trichoderma ghanense TaxID=65468 RepID=A0ABY2H4Z1_9HYPO